MLTHLPHDLPHQEMQADTQRKWHAPRVSLSPVSAKTNRNPMNSSRNTAAPALTPHGLEACLDRAQLSALNWKCRLANLPHLYAPPPALLLLPFAMQGMGQ